MSATATDWVNDLTLSPDPTRAEILAFFGIPPDPEESLEKNIAKKRRTWNAKKRERKLSPNAERKVTGALQMIEALSQAIIGGVEEDLDFSELDAAATALTGFSTVLELWAYVDELLADGNTDKALSVAREGVKRFGTDPDAQAALAYAVSQSLQFPLEPYMFKQLTEEGLAAANQAIDTEPGPEAPWGLEDITLWHSSFSIFLDRPEEALGTLANAEHRLGDLPPMLRISRARAYAHLGNDEEAREEVVRAVRGAPEDDLRVRSAGAEAMLFLATKHHLPISSSAEMKQYKDTVEVAAWCSFGVPEWEGIVRVHRLWAKQASSRIFIGTMSRKALVTLLSGFMLAPVINSLQSKRGWQVYLDGPEKCSQDTWFLTTYQGIAYEVNRDVADELPWFQKVVDAEDGTGEPVEFGKDSTLASKSYPLVVIGLFVVLILGLGLGKTFGAIFALALIGILMTFIIAFTSRLIPGGTPEVTLAGTSPEGAAPVVSAGILSVKDEYLGFPSGVFLPREIDQGSAELLVADEYSERPSLSPKYLWLTTRTPALFFVGLLGYLFYVLPSKLFYWLIMVVMKSRIEARLEPSSVAGEEACLVKLKFAGPAARVAGVGLVNALSEPLLPERYRSPEELSQAKQQSRGFESIKVFLIVNAVIYAALFIWFMQGVLRAN
jgi:tetratricopeptide (TPR) repeat protein